MDLLRVTRRAYIETNQRIRRALWKKVRVAEQSHSNSDMVYYKRKAKDWWLGPSKVAFHNGKVVFVRRVGVFVRVSPNRYQRMREDGSQAQEEISELPAINKSKPKRKQDQL